MILEAERNRLSVKNVATWLEQTDYHEARLSFFSGTNKDDMLFRRVLQPLLSCRSTGSIAVERIAKPFKQRVLEKHRNRLGWEKAQLLLRVGLNLNFLMNNQQELKHGVLNEEDLTEEDIFLGD